MTGRRTVHAIYDGITDTTSASTGLGDVDEPGVSRQYLLLRRPADRTSSSASRIVPDPVSPRRFRPPCGVSIVDPVRGSSMYPPTGPAPQMLVNLASSPLGGVKSQSIAACRRTLAGLACRLVPLGMSSRVVHVRLEMWRPTRDSGGDVRVLGVDPSLVRRRGHAVGRRWAPVHADRHCVVHGPGRWSRRAFAAS